MTSAFAAATHRSDPAVSATAVRRLLFIPFLLIKESQTHVNLKQMVCQNIFSLKIRLLEGAASEDRADL
jgi:hypothetical protein